MKSLCCRSLALVFLVALVACKKKAAPEVAHIEQVSAAVTVKHIDGTSEPATVGMSLQLEDQVINAGDGNAVVWFAGDNRITLPPQSIMAVERHDAGAQELGLRLLQGLLHIEMTGKGPHLLIGTPFGIAHAGTHLTILEVSIEHGLRVVVGEVDFERDNSIETVQEGHVITVNGLNLNIASEQAMEGLKFHVGGATDANAVADANSVADADDVVEPDTPAQPEVVSFVLYPRHTPRLRRGHAAPVPVTRRMSLKDGDGVLTAGQGAGSRVVTNDLGVVTLGGATEVDFASVIVRKGVTQSAYRVKTGAIDVHLVQVTGKPVQHTLQLADNANVVLTPTVRTADLDVHTGPAPRMGLHFGHAQVGNLLVEAGASIRFVEGQAQVGPLADVAVDVFEGRHSVVHHDKVVPALNFIFEGAPHTPTRIDIAQDPAFKRLIGAEEVTRGSFMFDQVNPAATYFWRVGGRAGHGVVTYKPESDSSCSSCKRVNMIDDTGEKTVVYYQQTLPALTFSWKTTDHAVNYNLKVFRDGQFDKPMLDEKTTETTRAFGAGRFAEGKYFWLVKPVDAQGHELSPGRMNSLQIAYDNAVTQLVIRAPKNNARVAEHAIVTAGESQVGTKLFIQGEAVPLDGDGRFSLSVKLHPGANTVVYRVVDTDKVEHMYVRQVMQNKP